MREEAEEVDEEEADNDDDDGQSKRNKITSRPKAIYMR